MSLSTEYFYLRCLRKMQIRQFETDIPDVISRLNGLTYQM